MREKGHCTVMKLGERRRKSQKAKEKIKTEETRAEKLKNSDCWHILSITEYCPKASFFKVTVRVGGTIHQSPPDI